MWLVQALLTGIGALALFSQVQLATDIPAGPLVDLYRTTAWPLLAEGWRRAGLDASALRPDWIILYVCLALLFAQVTLSGTGRLWKRGALGLLGLPVWWAALPLLGGADRQRFGAALLLVGVAAWGGVAFAG